MLKKICIRFLNGFSYAIAITLVIHSIIMYFIGHAPIMPEFQAGYANELNAYAIELLLIGVMSGITSAGTVVFETKRIGMILQSILFLIIMLSAWIPVACYVWGFHKYVGSMISTTISIIGTYAICWMIRYNQYKKDIEEINAKLKKRKEG